MLQQLDIAIGFVVVMSTVSLLVTMITQAASSFLGLRGRNLRDAIVAMIMKFVPNLDLKDAQALAEKALTNAVISDSTLSMAESRLDQVPLLGWLRKGWKLASAVRPEELHAVIKELAASASAAPAATAAAPAATAASPAAAPPPLQAASAAAAISISAPAQTAASLMTALREASPETSDAIATVRKRLESLAGNNTAEAKAFIRQFADVTDVTMINLRKWFNASQDRAQEWFTVHTRIVTVAASFVAAFLLQLDTFTLFQQIAGNPGIQAGLVGLSDPLQQRQAALSGTAAISGTANVGALIQAGQNIVTSYQSTGMQLLPNPYPPLFNASWPKPNVLCIFSGQWSWLWPHLPGILISGVLLSLGAPFWFNVLKSLTNLRPALAEAVDKSAAPPPPEDT